jgi:AraC family transcriptional regulator
MKYGYNSPDSFTRAFQNLHGITPSEARNNGHSLKAYPRITFHLSIKGGNEMNYRIVEKEAFRMLTLRKEFLSFSKGLIRKLPLCGKA